MPRLRHSPRLAGIAVAVGAIAVLAAAMPQAAAAHAFLVRASPEAGSRLAAAPRELALYFSEPFVRGSERISIRRAEGGTLALPRPASSGTVARQPLPSRLKGIFVVQWRVLSDDGHLSVGEFAFAVGAAGALPELKARSAPTPWSQVIASWLFFAGLALALGGLASESFVWRRVPELASTLVRAPVFAGAVLASLAAFAQLVFLAGERAGGGFSAGLDAAALARVLATRPGELTLVGLIAVAVAAALAAWPRVRPLALAPLLAAVAATSLRGHSGTSGHSWAVAADAAHLTGAALWVGALAHLVLSAARTDRLQLRAALAAGARRYASFALPAVLLIVAGGIVTALAEFREPSEVLHTGYGRTLLIKAAFVGLALALALAARRRALPTNPRLRLPLLRKLTAGELGALAAVLLVAAVLVNVAPPRSSAAPARLPQLGPPPLSGPAVRLADLAGQLAVGLAASERELQFTIIAPGGEPASGATLKAEAERPGQLSADLFPRPCGPGCFTIRFRLPRGTTAITAEANAPGWQGGRARFDVPWPPAPEQPAQLRRVARTMRAVPSLLLTERVTSGPGASARPVQYRLTGRALMATELYRAGAVDVRAIGRQRGLTELAFALPGSNVWYRMTIDRSDRVRRETIVSPGHLIRRTFAYPRASRPAPAAAGASSRTVPPPTGPFVLGREADDLAVGLAARPAGARLALTATVLGPDGNGVGGLNLTFVVRTRDRTSSAAAVPCGSGCYRSFPAVSGKPQLVQLQLERLGRPPALLRFPFPARWPPPSATALVRRATRVYRSLKTLVYDERLASSLRNVVRTRWEIVAPDRLTYRFSSGAEAVIIGSRRWDRDPGGSWRASAQSPLTQPSPVWGTPPARASLIGSGRVGGRPVWIVSFVDPGSPAWFTLAIDKATLRTLDLQMVAAAHFMHHRYSGFDRPLRIVPPR